jgi:hypothetical protein
MAKIYQQDTLYHTQPPVIELPNVILLNGQPYDKTTLVPIPFKEMNLNVNTETYCVGRVAWLKSNTSDGGREPLGNIYFTRGTPDIANPDMLVNDQDSNIVYLFPAPENVSGQYQPLHRISLDPLSRLDNIQISLDAGYGSRGMCFIGQNSTHFFICGVEDRGGDYGYERFGWMTKDSLSFANTAPSTRQSKVAYFCQDTDYYYLLHQSTYSTATYTRVYRVSKTTNVESALASLTHDVTSYDGWYHASQALELETDKMSAYWPQVIADSGLAFKWTRHEVDLTGATASHTTCTVDYTAGGGQSSVVVKPGQTGEGRTNLEAWAISDATNYICMLPTEHDQYTAENLATFRLYVYSIDPGDKDNLIFENYVDTDVRAWNVFQVQDDWKKIAVVHSAGLKFYTWNEGTKTYDMVQDLAFAIESVMRDANDRIWVRESDLSVNMISATSPTRVEIVMDQATYNYQGSNIATHADVSAYDIDNARIVANVNIVLEGAIYFTDDSQNKTIATSGSGDTQVDMVIKGSSYTRVLASVVV